jgi:flagellar protein FlaG
VEIDRVLTSSISSYYKDKVAVRQGNEQEVVVDLKQTSEGYFQEFTKEKIEEIVKGMNEFLQPAHTSLKFELHEELKEYYVKIIDDRTKEVVREIPPKKLLDMYAAMTQFLGLVVDKKI